MADTVYSIAIETLKKMYLSDKIDLNRIRKLYYDKKISKEEFDYITIK